MIARIVGGTVLLPDGRLEQADITLADGVITGIGSTERADDRTLDARGLKVLPGIIDLHGDGFERSLMPRPGVHFDHALALNEVDRVMVSHGITTGYLGLTVSWEPGLRCLEASRRTVAAVTEMRPGLAADFRLQIRWETFAIDAVDTIIGWLDDPVAPILAFNDHTTQTLNNRTDPKKVQKWAERSGLTTSAYLALVEQVSARQDEVPIALGRLAAAGRHRGTVMLSHDDRTLDDRAYYRRLGATVAEFPLTDVAIRDAHEHREATVLGAPNVLRGGSHTGALGATEMVLAGLCDVLASDYYYPAPLACAFKLVREHGLPLGRVWPLVSENAARAVRLFDRGTLAAGQRADIILVDDRSPVPTVVATFTAGRLVHLARDLGSGSAFS